MITLTPQVLRQARINSKMKWQQFANAMHLRNIESLWRYETGKRPISQKLDLRFKEWQTGLVVSGMVLSKQHIPDGTIVPGEYHECEAPLPRSKKICGQGFMRMKSTHRYHSHACAVRAWRARQKGNGK